LTGKRSCIVLTLIAVLLIAGCSQSATEADMQGDAEEYEGVVRQVLAEEERTVPYQDKPVQYQLLEVELATPPFSGDVVQAEAGLLMSGQSRQFRPGDRVVLMLTADMEADTWTVIDVVRRPALYWLAAIFAVAVTLIGGWRGISSMVGLAISFVVLIKFILPQLLGGANPVLVSISGATIILVTTMYLAHGISKKTTVAVVGTALSLVATGLLASYFLKVATLSGASEEAYYLQTALGDTALNLQGLLLAAIIIGALGVLDDITISQSAVVFALQDANRKLRWRELFSRAMIVGQDHIASMVNTLVLAYAGAALPLLLLFVTFDVPFGVALNREIIAAEIVRTLVGSLGLVTAVPITTALAAYVSPHAAQIDNTQS